MEWFEALFLFTAAIGAGALKAIAGGGTFLIFPILVFSGIDPVRATATCIVALWPGDVASVLAYRRELVGLRSLVLKLGVVSLLGSALGATLLLRIPKTFFGEIVPFILLAASLIFTIGDRIPARLRGSELQRGDAPRIPPGVAYAIQFLLAVYAGFFGAGLGILMLSLFLFMGLKSIHQMNALKNTLGLMLNGLSSAIFLASSAVAWEHAGVMILGTSIGGYFSAVWVQRVEPRKVRRFIVAVAWGMTGYFFWRAFATM
jgi:uncharacterized protein